MSQFTLTQDFSAIQSQNLSDRLNGTAGSAWTQGGTLLDIVDPLVIPGRGVTILSVEFFVGLTILFGGGGSFGKLGKIIAGIDTNRPRSRPGSGQPWQNPILPFPSDLSLITTLYDGDTDSAPPFFTPGPTGATNVRPLIGGLNLPQPIKIFPGTAVNVGIWLSPSLVSIPFGGFTECPLQCYNSRYTIIYDDNA